MPSFTRLCADATIFFMRGITEAMLFGFVLADKVATAKENRELPKWGGSE